jgi:hypothetical protein
MADFERTQMEVQNTLAPEENAVVIADPTTPTQRATVNALGQLSVVVSGGGSAGFLTLDNQVAALGVDVGRVQAGFDGTNYQFVSVNSAGRLQVDVVSGGGGGTLVLDGQLAVPATDTGLVMAGYDGTNYQFVAVDSGGNLQVDVLNFPASQAVTGPLTDAELRATAVPVSGPLTDAELRATPVPVSATDLDIRDLLHSQDSVRIGDGTNLVDVLNDGGTYRLQVEAKIAAGGASQDVRLVDDEGDALAITEGEDLVTNGKNFGMPIAGRDLSDLGRLATVTQDSEDGKNRLEVSGKFSISAPPPPPAATPKQVAADTPLDVTGTLDTDYEITDGTTFTVQSITGGSEGDPTEKGAKIEVIYVDFSLVEHVISRIYLVGQSIQVFPDTSTARDGTALVGNATAGQGLIRVRRLQFGGGTRELEAVVRGFEE